MVLDITTHGNTGLTGSDTRACSGKLSSGMRRPARAITTLVWPAATTPTRGVRIGPFEVSTPAMAPSRVAHEAQHLAVLDDVDANRIGAARVAPGDRIVARDAAAALQGGADHGIAHVRRDVERRAERLGLLRRSATRCRCRSSRLA